jgi:hypothetical protein
MICGVSRRDVHEREHLLESARRESNAHSRFRKPAPCPLDYGPMETRRELNPISGFADRLSPGESRAIASPVRFERTTPRSGTWCAIQLRHGDMKCAGKDSNLRVGYLVYTARNVTVDRPSSCSIGYSRSAPAARFTANTTSQCSADGNTLEPCQL